MSQKKVELPGIGPVILAKRKGAKNLRLTILPDGRVRVSMPPWVPYSAGISFAAARSSWINEHKTQVPDSLLLPGQRIGKSYRLDFKTGSGATQARLGINSITITSKLAPDHNEVQQKARAAAERALKKEANLLLSNRLKELSLKTGLRFRDFKVKRLKSRWGSCSNRGDIALNYYLVQLPWNLIDYVIVHELAHTKHHNHSRQFWQQVNEILPDYKSLRKEIKNYHPVVFSY